MRRPEGYGVSGRRRRPSQATPAITSARPASRARKPPPSEPARELPTADAGLDAGTAGAGGPLCAAGLAGADGEPAFRGAACEWWRRWERWIAGAGAGI